LIAVDLNGCLTFYGLGDSKFRNKILLEKQYCTESMTKAVEAFPVTALKFDSNQQLLIIGD
jgi:hypothetical protein